LGNRIGSWRGIDEYLPWRLAFASEQESSSMTRHGDTEEQKDRVFLLHRTTMSPNPMNRGPG
jgi:hypothetical protein